METIKTNKGTATRHPVGATGQLVWFAYGLDGKMLRDKRGVGRRFKTKETALKALQ